MLCYRLCCAARTPPPPDLHAGYPGLPPGLFMIDGDPVESDEIHVKVLNKALPVFHIKPAEGAARDDGARSTDQQARVRQLITAS